LTEEDEMTDTVMEKADEVTEKATPDGNGSLAKKVLIPAAAGLGTLAATYAASKAPSLMREKVLPKVEERGSEEVAKVGKKAASKLTDGGGLLGAVAGKAVGKSGGGREKTRRLPIQRWTDVAVPVDTAYEKWTQFEDFPKFMHRVLSVEEKEDNRVSWEEKIWFSKRQWEAEILQKRKNDRIVWKTVQGTSHTGLISFHKLDTNLTRVMVTVDFRPTGMFEKMASGLRFAKRAVQADLARFKAYVEMDEVEGAEYTQAATTEAESKGDEAESKGDDGGDGGDDEGRQSSNGRADTAELEESRKERAERREQRRS
jgi:uncharacterized membrane protein